MVIAYIDVAGYQDILYKRGEYELFADIHMMIQTAGLMKLQSDGKDVKVKFLTDSGIIYFEDNEDDQSNSILNGLIIAIGKFQFIALTKCNLMIRGGITTGYLYDEEFIFGNGYLKALKLEQDVADYQRIVVDDLLLNRLIPPLRENMIYNCYDDKKMIDYISCEIGPDPNESDAHKVLEQHERSLGILGSEALKNTLDSLVDQIAKGINPRISEFIQFQKINERYSHVLEYHLKTCDKYNYHSKSDNPTGDINIKQSYDELINSIKDYDSNDMRLNESIEHLKAEYKRTMKFIKTGKA